MVDALPGPASKRPSGGRLFLLLVLAAASMAPAWVRAEEPTSSPVSPGTRTVTEAEVVRQALGRAPLIDALEGAVEVERGTAVAVAARPNPQLNYAREHTFGPLGTGEDYVSVSHTFDLSRRRRLRGHAAQQRAVAVEHDGEAVLAELAAEARLRFYELLHRQHRVRARRAFIAEIERALAIVERREARGDAARYDRRRLEREQSIALDGLEAELGALEHAQARLGALLEGLVDTGIVASGSLLPTSEPPALESLREALSQRPDLRALDSRQRAATIDRKVAARWWVPDLWLAGGWKGVATASQGRTDGYMLGATLTLPLWNTSAGLTRSANAEARVAQNRRDMIEAEALAELTGLRAEAVRLVVAARRARERSVAASADLVRIASTGYEGGELSVLELLDAYRGAADDELAALELEHAARRAHIELDRVTGVVP
jgi:outer membrane protein, heavy metal efflux system